MRWSFHRLFRYPDGTVLLRSTVTTPFVLRRLTTAVLAVLGLLAGLLVVGASRAEAATGLTVFDWNIEGGSAAYDGARWRGIVSEIRSANPDIVTLQEVHRSAGTRVDGHPGIDQVTALEKAFPGYHFLWARGDGTMPTGSSAGNLIFSRYTIKARLVRKLPSLSGCPTNRDHYADHSSCPVNRVLGGVDLDVNGTDVRVYTTQLTPGYNGKAPALRAAQSNAAAAALPQNHLNLPMFFTGDLNYRPADTNRARLAQTRFYDVWTQQLPNDESGYGTHGSARIDYVYSTPAADVSSVRAGNSSGLSDHRPVIASMVVRGSRPSNVGVVLAGTRGYAGWANMTVFGDHAGYLRVCDNRYDGVGIRATVRSQRGTKTYVSATDAHEMDRCGYASASQVPAAFQLQVCLVRGSTATDCRTKNVG